MGRPIEPRLELKFKGNFDQVKVHFYLKLKDSRKYRIELDPHLYGEMGLIDPYFNFSSAIR